jgi:hypothetical protein
MRAGAGQAVAPTLAVSRKPALPRLSCDILLTFTSGAAALFVASVQYGSGQPSVRGAAARRPRAVHRAGPLRLYESSPYRLIRRPEASSVVVVVRGAELPLVLIPQVSNETPLAPVALQAIGVLVEPSWAQRALLRWTQMEPDVCCPGDGLGRQTTPLGSIPGRTNRLYGASRRPGRWRAGSMQHWRFTNASWARTARRDRRRRHTISAFWPSIHGAP